MSEPKRTEFAMKAMDLAELFKILLAEDKIGGGGNIYRPELSAPDGPSTGGGKQAVQHVKLVPETGGATIVAGNCNQVEQSAEIRTYNHLATLHAQRFKGAKIPLDEHQYADFLMKVQTFFNDRGLRVTVLDAPPPVLAKGAAPAPASGGGSQMGLIIAVVVITAALVGAGMFFILRGH